jgi:hypothetical protein
VNAEPMHVWEALAGLRSADAEVRYRAAISLFRHRLAPSELLPHLFDEENPYWPDVTTAWLGNPYPIPPRRNQSVELAPLVQLLLRDLPGSPTDRQLRAAFAITRIVAYSPGERFIEGLPEDARSWGLALLPILESLEGAERALPGAFVDVLLLGLRHESPDLQTWSLHRLDYTPGLRSDPAVQRLLFEARGALRYWAAVTQFDPEVFNNPPPPAVYIQFILAEAVLDRNVDRLLRQVAMRRICLAPLDPVVTEFLAAVPDSMPLGIQVDAWTAAIIGGGRRCGAARAFMERAFRSQEYHGRLAEAARILLDPPETRDPEYMDFLLLGGEWEGAP